MDRYERLGENLGEGTYGKVYKARDRRTDIVVAVKSIKFIEEMPGANFTALREVKILRELRHENLVLLRDVFFGESAMLSLVFEFCVTNLEELLRDKQKFLAPGDCKTLFQHLLQGLEHCHANFVLHRDLKPANLLINDQGVMKITDFGLARFHGSPQLMTAEVMTVWYRPPELLLGAREYAHAVDMWSAGCIFGEILRRTPLFMGKDTTDQLKCIFQALGTPTEETWPDWELLPGRLGYYINPASPQDLRIFFPGVSDDAYALMMRLLSLNPGRRPDCTEALNDPYFVTEPSPSPLEQIAQLVRPAEEVETTTTTTHEVHRIHHLLNHEKANETATVEPAASVKKEAA